MNSALKLTNIFHCEECEVGNECMELYFDGGIKLTLYIEEKGVHCIISHNDKIMDMKSFFITTDQLEDILRWVKKLDK